MSVPVACTPVSGSPCFGAQTRPTATPGPAGTLTITICFDSAPTPTPGTSSPPSAGPPGGPPGGQKCPPGQHRGLYAAATAQEALDNQFEDDANDYLEVHWCDSGAPVQEVMGSLTGLERWECYFDLDPKTPHTVACWMATGASGMTLYEIHIYGPPSAFAATVMPAARAVMQTVTWTAS
jgi:hypothetical protein